MAWGKFLLKEAQIFYLLDNALEKSIEVSVISMIEDMLNHIEHSGNNKFAMIVYSCGTQLQWKYVKCIDRFLEAEDVEFERGQVPMIIRAKDVLKLLNKDSLDETVYILKEQIIEHFQFRISPNYSFHIPKTYLQN